MMSLYFARWGCRAILQADAIRFIHSNNTLLANLLSTTRAEIVYFDFDKGRDRLNLMEKDIGGCDNQLMIATVLQVGFIGSLRI